MSNDKTDFPGQDADGTPTIAGQISSTTDPRPAEEGGTETVSPEIERPEGESAASQVEEKDRN